MDAEFLKILANHGAPAILLFAFLIYFSKAIKHLANSIQEVANRFDAILQRHEGTITGIANAVNQMTQENTRLTATLNNIIQFASQVYYLNGKSYLLVIVTLHYYPIVSRFSKAGTVDVTASDTNAL